MSNQTLSSAPSIAASASAPRYTTYSVDPVLSVFPKQRVEESPAPIESFLEAENPLGCLRGVMWVMAFNTAAVLLGVAIWQSCKHLL